MLVRRCGFDMERFPKAAREQENAAVYLELHIEQGPVLEGLGLPLGVVLGTKGVERHGITFHGQEAHSGSTPMKAHRDALAAAAQLALEIRTMARKHSDAVCSMDSVKTFPGIVTSVVGRCEATLDQRDLDAGVLASMYMAIGVRTVNHWIGGHLVASASGRSGVVWNPATGEAQAKVDFASVEEVNDAVAAAKSAFLDWRATPLGRRSEVMFKVREMVDANRRQIAELLTLEHGKTLPDAMGEVARGLENIEFACGVPHLLKGGFSEQSSRGIDTYQIHQPLGVVAGITPFNFPAMVPMWMFGNAIACGNAFILKPSEKDPSVSLFIAELLQKAGVPDGVFTVLQGDKVAVDRLLEHPDVKAISFVGSTPIARSIYETATRNGKRVQALAGAKNHMLVLPDADIPMAADAAISAAYGSAGERCMAISIIVAVGAVADPLVSAIRERISRTKVGSGLEAGNEMGPLITREHRDHVASYVTDAASEGATVAVDGRQDIATKSNGFFLGASLLDQVQPGMNCYRDEIFGPVLGVVRVNTYDEALRLINDNPYGNGVAIFTRDGGAARQFQFDVDAGMVGINVPIPVPVAYYSFGGWKASLFGDLHMYGPEGMQFYTKSKVVTSRWPDPGSSKMDLGFPQSR